MSFVRPLAIAFVVAALLSCAFVWPLVTASLCLLALAAMLAPPICSLIRIKRTADPSDFIGAARP